jgi:hypothetical protein
MRKHAIRSVAKKKQKRASLEQFMASASSATTQEPLAPPEITATLNLMPEDHSLPAHRVQLITTEPDAIPPGYTALYKGKAAAEMMSMEVEDSWIQDDGSLLMEVLSSYAGGDFNWRANAHYWTPDQDVAEEYRQWAARRCCYSETWLIRILISDSFVNSLQKATLFYSPEWKEYVWSCKKRRQPRPEFDYLWKDAPIGVDMIQGHICTGVNSSITHIPAKDVQTRMTDDHVLRVGETDTKATQWAFIQVDSIKRLGEEIRGRIHIDITASVQSKEEEGSPDTKALGMEDMM